MKLNGTKKQILLGIVAGLVAMCLALGGNPKNMAFCIACFIRDTAGSLGLHQAEAVQYARPEIIGLVTGSFLIALATKEYRSTGGSAPMLRFVLGIIMMIGSLVFLGCPLRMILRMTAGDLNAWVGLIGFILGICTGIVALKKGFRLGRSYPTPNGNGAILPLIMVGILILALGTSLLKASVSGPGSLHAPILLSLAGGLIFGVVAQKSRMCFAGGIRDIILTKDFSLFSAVAGIFVVMLLYNMATGNFVPGFETPGVIAHPEHLWNLLGMYAVGFAAVLAGGCPLRQLILAGQGSSDSAVTVMGMLLGAALCHNLGLAASATSTNTETKTLVLGSVPTAGKIACIICIALCFVIAFTNRQTDTK